MGTKTMPKPRKHKRKGPKSTRAGCLLCKPHKDQAMKGSRGALTPQEIRAADKAAEAAALLEEVAEELESTRWRA